MMLPIAITILVMIVCVSIRSGQREANRNSRAGGFDPDQGYCGWGGCG
jgi:hypothetical protein